MVQLTDFGLSKVGLINSTDDLSRPDVSNSTSFEDLPTAATQRAEKREQRRKQSAVGTPDYLAPEILLGMPHGLLLDNFLLFSLTRFIFKILNITIMFHWMSYFTCPFGVIGRLQKRPCRGPLALCPINTKFYIRTFGVLDF